MRLTCKKPKRGFAVKERSSFKLSIFDPKLRLSLKKKLLKRRCSCKFYKSALRINERKTPLYESLISLEEMYRVESFHHIIHSMVEHIKKGGSLSSALAKFPDSFSSLYVAMIRAGEAIGALDKTLIKLAELITKQNRLKKKFVTSLIYPGLLFGLFLFCDYGDANICHPFYQRAF